MRRLLVLLPLSLLLAACGGNSSTSEGGGSVQQTIQISEQEYSLDPGTVTVSKTGTYEFKVTNNGKIAHALEVEGNGVEEKTGDIQPGAAATLRVTHRGRRVWLRRNDDQRRRNHHQRRVRVLTLQSLARLLLRFE
jgi:hypothetical protein